MLTQGIKTCTNYFKDAKHIAHQLAATRKPIEDHNLITFLVAGLKLHFYSFNFAKKENDLSLEDFYSELLNHETLLEIQHAQVVKPSIFAFIAKSGVPNYLKKTKPQNNSFKP